MPRSRLKTAKSKPQARPDRKWVNLGAASGSLSEAARLSIGSRLGSVEAYLPLAAYRHKETIEHVHQLRVSTRRTLAALVLYQNQVPRKHLTWMRKRMKRVRKAAGEARDLDVLMERFENVRIENEEDANQKRLIRHLKKLRKKSQKSIVQLCDRMMDDRQLNRHSEKLVRSIPIGKQANLEEFAKSQIEHQAELFFGYAPEDLRDIEQLHRFRVQAKEFRYTIELLNDALPSEVRTQVYPIVCKTQEMLGELNDHSIACMRLKQLAVVGSLRPMRKRLKRLSRLERDEVIRLKEQFHSWWTPETSHRFEAIVQSAIADTCTIGAAG